MNAKPVVKFNICLPDDLYKELEKIMAETHRNRSNAIQYAVKLCIDQHNKGDMTGKKHDCPASGCGAKNAANRKTA
jgi:metal-responsive CopG/Arc/MetJ family transcriptional regulator